MSKSFLTLQILNIFASVLSIITFVYLLHENIIYIKVYSSIFTLDPILFSAGFIFFFIFGIILLFYLLIKSHAGKIDALKIKGKLLPIILFSIMILMIFATLFDRTMDEKNLFVAWTRQYTHSAVFIQPIYDLLNGKAVLSNTDSMYGVLVGLFPAVIFKLIPLTFTNFFYLMIAFGIFYYLCTVFLLKKRLGSFSWAFAGLLMLFSMHFYPLLDRYLRPMVFPIRYLLDIPFFLLLLFKTKNNWKLEVILTFFLAFAVFYNFESGIAMVISFLVYCILKVFNNSKATLIDIVQAVLRKVFFLVSAFVFIGFLYSLYAKSVSGLFPDWSRLLFYVRIFGAGQTQDIEQSLYLLPALIYLVALIRAGFFIVRRKVDKYTPWDTGISVYGLIILTNYISRSYIINLIAVGIPAIILAIIYFKELCSYLYARKKTISDMPVISFYFILGSFIIFSFIYYAYRLPHNARVDYWRGDKIASEALLDKIDDSAPLIGKYLPESKNITLLSFFDTLVLLRTKKINSIPYGTSQNIMTKTQSTQILSSIRKNNPQYVFADSDNLLRDNIYQDAYLYLDQNYEKIESRGILDVWKRIK